MSKRKKRLERLRKNPKVVTIEQLRQVLEDHGFILKRIKGSHYLFEIELEGENRTLTIPVHTPHIKVVYIKQSLQLIDTLASAEEEEVEDGEHDS
jgi:predicted RNA binding protein YcfA (HicA-like mRNA interferase family)